MTLSVEELGKGLYWYHVHDYWVSKLSNNLPSFTTKGKLCECIAADKFEFPLRDLNSNSLHRNSMHYYWATTPLFRSVISHPCQPSVCLDSNKKYIFRIHIFIVLCSPYKDNKMRSIILFSCCLLDQILLLFIKGLVPWSAFNELGYIE